VSTHDKKNGEDASVITRLIADSVAFAFCLFVIIPVFGLIASALVGLAVMYGVPMLGAVLWLLVYAVTIYVIYRVFKHVREDPKRQVKPIVREIKRFIRELKEM